jgi:hypothetical protein
MQLAGHREEISHRTALRQRIDTLGQCCNLPVRALGYRGSREKEIAEGAATIWVDDPDVIQQVPEMVLGRQPQEVARSPDRHDPVPHASCPRGITDIELLMDLDHERPRADTAPQMLGAAETLTGVASLIQQPRQRVCLARTRQHVEIDEIDGIVLPEGGHPAFQHYDRNPVIACDRLELAQLGARHEDTLQFLERPLLDGAPQLRRHGHAIPIGGDSRFHRGGAAFLAQACTPSRSGKRRRLRQYRRGKHPQHP